MFSCLSIGTLRLENDFFMKPKFRPARGLAGFKCEDVDDGQFDPHLTFNMQNMLILPIA